MSTQDTVLRINLNTDDKPNTYILYITHSPFTLSNISSLNLVSTFRCFSPPHNPVYTRRIDPWGIIPQIYVLVSHDTDTHIQVFSLTLFLSLHNHWNNTIYHKVSSQYRVVVPQKETRVLVGHIRNQRTWEHVRVRRVGVGRVCVCILVLDDRVWWSVGKKVPCPHITDPGS
jgi:hypothetical protein